jgi:hypothetical protein
LFQNRVLSQSFVCPTTEMKQNWRPGGRSSLAPAGPPRDTRGMGLLLLVALGLTVIAAVIAVVVVLATRGVRRSDGPEVDYDDRPHDAIDRLPPPPGPAVLGG